MRAIPLLALTTLFLSAIALSGAEATGAKVLIITGDEYHKWKETAPFLKKLLTKAGHTVDITETPSKDLTSDNLAKYDVLLLNYRDTPKGAKDNPRQRLVGREQDGVPRRGQRGQRAVRLPLRLGSVHRQVRLRQGVREGHRRRMAQAGQPRQDARVHRDGP